MSWVIQVYNIQKSSQLLSVWSISANIQCVFWTNLTNTIIFYQIDFVANFPLYILIEGSSKQLLVISQFLKFFAEMPHISAERHLSKILFDYFLLPLTSSNCLRQLKNFTCPQLLHFLLELLLNIPQ